MLNVQEYTLAELRLAKTLRILGFLFAIAAFGYLLPALIGPNKGFFINLPFVTNSAVKVSVLALLSFQASGDVRRYRVLIPIVIVGHIISIIACIAALIWGNAHQVVTFVIPFLPDQVFPIFNAGFFRRMLCAKIAPPAPDPTMTMSADNSSTSCGMSLAFNTDKGRWGCTG